MTIDIRCHCGRCFQVSDLGIPGARKKCPDCGLEVVPEDWVSDFDSFVQFVSFLSIEEADARKRESEFRAAGVDPQFDWEGQHDWHAKSTGDYLLACRNSLPFPWPEATWKGLAEALVEGKRGYKVLRKGDREGKPHPPAVSLEFVRDRTSFFFFMTALGVERCHVEESLSVGSANGEACIRYDDVREWQCHDISSYLSSCCARVEERAQAAPIDATWKTLGQFLYYGKFANTITDN